MLARWSPMVDQVSVERFLPHADPAPCAAHEGAYRVGGDVGGVGMLGFYMLYGYSPFERHSLKATWSDIQKCEFRIPDGFESTPANLVSFVIACLSKEAPERLSASREAMIRLRNEA
mgnify:CR=1 FL=1